MKNFSRDKRSGKSKDYSKRGSRDAAKPAMHQTTCNNCGKDCEVPFKPTSGKPIYCSKCFDKQQNEEPKRFSKERGGRVKTGDSRKRSFDTRDSGADNKGKEADQLKKEIAILNKKVDKILEILTEVLSANNYSDEYEEETE